MSRYHGKMDTPEYRSLASAVQRCTPSNAEAYPYHAGKGIRVCSRWYTPAGPLGMPPAVLHIDVFISDMGPRPEGTSLERIDGDGDYSPENCCWATIEEQANNTSANILMALGGRTMTLSQWARERGLGVSTVWGRVRRGWSVEEALSLEVRKGKKYEMGGEELTVKEWAERFSMPVDLVRSRLRQGLGIREALERKRSGRPRERAWTGRGQTKTLGEWSKETGLSVAVLDRRIRAGKDEERVLEPTLRQLKKKVVRN